MSAIILAGRRLTLLVMKAGGCLYGTEGRTTSRPGLDLGAASRMAASGRPRYAFLQCGRGEAQVMAGPEGQKAAAGRGPRTAGADHRTAMRVVALAAVVHMLRSRRFYQRMITVVIAVGAIRRIGQENQASTMARLTAWDKRQVQRLERKAKRQGQVIKGSGQMMRSGAPRHLATKDRT